MNDDSPLETTEQRIQRYWRNNKLILDIIEKQDNIEILPPQHPPQITNHLAQLRQFQFDIRRIINQRPTEMLTRYLISIQMQKNKLLREKLRRLESASQL